jgi:UDP-2-acetamido-2-deoxy-ribo-hexuluronate aminotransferase
MIKAIEKVIAHGQFINGPEVEEFEKKLSEYLDVKHVITCANGTDALQLAYMATLEPDSWILMPSFNYVSSAEAAIISGNNIEFCDVDYDTYNVSPDTVYDFLSRDLYIDAVVAVSLFGLKPNLTEIKEMCDGYGCILIEDNAQSLGAKHNGKHLTGLIGTTSFFPTKNLACMGDGGAVYTNDDKIAKLVRALKSHGQAKEKYHYDYVGINSRLDTIQAAILIERLKGLELKINAQRMRAYSVLGAIDTQHTYNNIVVKERKKYPNNRVYYPKPFHKQKPYKRDYKLPVTEKLCREVTTL